MSAKKKQSAKAFRSFRILGKTAQGLIQRAKKAQDQRQPKPVRPPHTDYGSAMLVHISTSSIVKGAFAVLAIGAGTWTLLHIRDKIILLLLGTFVAVVIDPGVQAMQRLKIPRGVAILIHYVLALLIVLFLFLSFIPIIAQQIQQIALFISAQVNAFLADPQISLPLMSEEVNQRLTVLVQTSLQDLSIHEFTDALQQLGQNLATAAQGSFRFAAQLAGSVVNFVIDFIIVLVLGFFLQLEKEKISRWVRGFFPRRYLTYVDSKTEAIHLKIGQWARGEVMLMLSIFLLTLLALVILRMPYALTLAVLAGFCEFIPAVGPLIAAIPAVLIALSHEGVVWALVVAGVYYVIQWCENNLLVPLIMKRAVGLSPPAIIFAMLVGISFPETLHPVLGVMLAIPTTTIIALFLEDWLAVEDRSH